ncbi:MAG: GNAT family N-acetyltransferase [Bacteroidetes bacterium]|nr:GNAT family N-acetyltransferase [Bacteroidota bacterium]
MLEINFNPFPILKTERLTLRQYRESDKGEMHKMRSDPKLMHFVPRPMTTSEEDAAAFITLLNESAAKNEFINWAITFTGEDKLIGMIGLFRMNLEHFRTEIGYMLMTEYHGKQIMQEAIDAAVKYAFEELKFHSLEAVISPDNIPSQKTIEKCGFVREAYFKDYEFYKGAFKDILVYSKITTLK